VLQTYLLLSCFADLIVARAGFGIAFTGYARICTQRAIRKPLTLNARHVGPALRLSKKGRSSANLVLQNCAQGSLSILLPIGFRVATWVLFSIAPGVQAKWNKRITRREPTKSMFGITSETLRQFSLGEILLLIAINIETSRLASEDRALLTAGTVLIS
jgi:hypothetical protein